MSVDSATVVNLLENILFEAPAVTGGPELFWMEQSQQDPALSTVRGLGAAMAASGSEIGVAEHVYELYTSVLGRAPTGTEISYYTAVAEAGIVWPLSGGALPLNFVPQSALDQVTDYIAASPEFAHKYLSPAPGVTAIDPIAALYQNILGRTASSSELSYYQTLVDQGTSLSTLVKYFLGSAEYQSFAPLAAQNALVNFGVGVASNGGAGHDGAVGGGTLPPAIAVPLAGGAYAGAPPVTISMGNGPYWVEVHDAAMLVVDSATSFNASVSSAAQAVGALEAGIQAHHVAWGVYGGNTYVAESETGTVGPMDTTTIELIGVHGLAGTAATGPAVTGMFHVA